MKKHLKNLEVVSTLIKYLKKRRMVSAGGILIIILATIILFNPLSEKINHFTKFVSEKFSVLGQELSTFFFPNFPQRLMYVTSEISSVSEELVLLNEELSEFINECDCKYADSQCEQIIKEGIPTDCKPGLVKVFGEVCPGQEQMNELGETKITVLSDIHKLTLRLSFLQELLQKEMDAGLEKQLATLMPDDAQILRENLQKLLDLNPEIKELSEKNITLPDECSVKRCTPECELQETFTLNACFLPGEQKPIELKMNVGVGLKDLDLGEVKIRDIDLNLPNEIEAPPLPELPGFTIPVPNVVIRCPTEKQTVVFHSPSPPLPKLPTLKFGCPTYQDSTYQCNIPPEEEEKRYIEMEWYYQTFSHLSENCLEVIKPEDINQLTTEEGQNQYQELMKKCLSPEKVVQTIIEECDKKWRWHWLFLGGYWYLPAGSPEICRQIGCPPGKTPCNEPSRNERAINWCQRALQDMSENKSVCIDHYVGLIYERDGAKARVYISGTDPSGTDWGKWCGGVPGFGNTNSGKVLALEWDWAEVPDNIRVEVQGERRSDLSPSVETGPVIYTKPDSLTGTETEETVGNAIDPASGAHTYSDLRARLTWLIPGVDPPTSAACSSNPVETLNQKCQELREVKIEEAPLSCKLLPLFAGSLEDALPGVFIGQGGTCPAQTIGDYPASAIPGCSIAFPSVPKISFPKIIIPDIQLPTFNFRPFFYIKLPNFIFEDLILPDIELCDLSECQFKLPFLSLKPPQLKIPEIAPAVSIPEFPQKEIKISPIQIQPLSFKPPEPINLGQLTTPKAEIPKISLPKPELRLSFAGLKIDLLNLLLGLFKWPTGGCWSQDINIGPINIVYPDKIFPWPAFPEIPEIPFCKDVRQFCQRTNASLKKMAEKNEEIQNFVNTVFQNVYQQPLNKIAERVQKEIEEEIQAQLDIMAEKIKEKLKEHIATYAPEYLPEEIPPQLGVWPVEKPLPCDLIPELVIPMDDIHITPKSLSQIWFEEIGEPFPEKISINWPESLKKVSLKMAGSSNQSCENDEQCTTVHNVCYEGECFNVKEVCYDDKRCGLPLAYQLPTIPLSNLSWPKSEAEARTITKTIAGQTVTATLTGEGNITIKLPGLQQAGFPSIDFDLVGKGTGCKSKPPSGGNPCKTEADQIKNNFEMIKETKEEIKQSFQDIKDVLY